MSTTQTITATLEQELLTGHHMPGDRFLSEHELCARFGVSRTPVREALKRLEAAGLLVARHGSGTYVAERDAMGVGAAIRRFSDTGREFGAMLELMETRRILEVGVVWTAAEFTARDPARVAPLVSALSKMDALIARKASLKACAEADILFHHALALCTGNPLIIAIHEAMLPALQKYVFGFYKDLEVFVVSQGEHQAIYRAIVAGDSVAAAHALQAHLKRSLDLVLTRIAETGSLSAAAMAEAAPED